MTSNPESAARKRKVTLSLYIRRRNGVPAGASGGLRNMLHRSLGARSFAGFWRYWNPLFGYFLGKYIYAPLKRILPPALALILTFLFCGVIHDLVTTAVRGSPAFLFTPWFFFLALGLLGGRVARMDLSGQRWLVRASAHLAYLSSSLAAALAVKRLYALWT